MNIEWFYIRSLIFSSQWKKGIKLCAVCDHPEAKDFIKFEEELEKGFLSISPNPPPPIIQCFFQFMTGGVLFSFIQELANEGYPYALALRGKYAEAAEKGEPLGLIKLERWEEAANLGSFEGSVNMFTIPNHPERWKYYVYIRIYTEEYFPQKRLTEANRYQIGKYVNKHKRIMNIGSKDIIFMNFYEYQNKAYRNAVLAWSICADRMGICFDVKILISKMIWGRRNEALAK